MDQLRSAYQFDRRSKFRFYLRLFLDLFDVALVNSFIVHKKLENKDLTLNEFKIFIALKLIASFVSWPILSELLSIQAYQSSKTWLDTSITFANFLGGKTTMYCMLPSRKREQNLCYVLIMWCSRLPSKRKKLLFHNITHKSAVTHILKTLLEHDFYDVNICWLKYLLRAHYLM